MAPEVVTTASGLSFETVAAAMGLMTLPMAILLIFINYLVRKYEVKRKEEAEKQKEIDQRDREEARKVLLEAQNHRQQENLCIIRAIRDTGALSRITTVGVKAQAEGKTAKFNGEVDKALQTYDNTMKELNEFLIVANAKNHE